MHGHINAETVGIIHSIETCGTVDGPGIRYVIFTQGCPLRCVYCQNPDTWAANGSGASRKTVSKLMQDILKYKSYFRFSGGGVTLTGGEPLMQKEFSLGLFASCKREGLHTVLDTSGYCDIDGLTEDILKVTDLVLLDVKSVNPDTYKKTTGFPIGKTLRFARHLSETGIETWIRFVLIPGLTDDDAELHDLAAYLTGLKNVGRVSVLPFHQMGAYKWQNLGFKYQLIGTPTPTDEETERVREMFRGYGLVVR